MKHKTFTKKHGIGPKTEAAHARALSKASPERLGTHYARLHHTANTPAVRSGPTGNRNLRQRMVGGVEGALHRTSAVIQKQGPGGAGKRSLLSSISEHSRFSRIRASSPAYKREREFLAGKGGGGATPRQLAHARQQGVASRTGTIRGADGVRRPSTQMGSLEIERLRQSAVARGRGSMARPGEKVGEGWTPAKRSAAAKKAAKTRSSRGSRRPKGMIGGGKY